MADRRHVVLDAIRDNGPVRLEEIQRLTALGRTTVSTLINELRLQGAVVVEEAERSQAPAGTGRRPILVSLNPELARVVGIQFEHVRVRASIADLGLKRLAEDARDLPVSEDPRAALAAAAEMVAGMMAKIGVQRSGIIGAAAALEAPVEESTGTVRASTALRRWVDLRPALDLSRRLRIPVTVGNDATMAGFGEAVCGAARGQRHVVYVKLSASIGCGIVIDGSPYGGAFGTAGELAHLVTEDSGDLCYCGNRGCLLTVVGGRAILAGLDEAHRRQLREAEANRRAPLTQDDRLRLVIEWAKAGDPACVRMLREVGQRVGVALVNICNLLNPETVIVGGVLSLAGDLLFEPMQERVHATTRHLYPSPVKIVPPQLDDWAEVTGACALVARSNTPELRERLQDMIDQKSGSG
jgi:predicted NBD/HSP70 family sugar kinase